MNKKEIDQLESEIRMAFPIGNDTGEQFVSSLIADAVNGVGTEYLEIGYELSAMYFEDAMSFLPIILLGELQLLARNDLDQCFMCVVDLIVEWGDVYVGRLSVQQRITLCKWLHAISDNRDVVNTPIVKSGLVKAFRILGAE